MSTATALVGGTAAAEPGEPEAERGKNSVSIRGAVALVANQAEDGTRERTTIGGFVLSYERVIIEDWLIVEIALPVLYGKEHIEFPADVHLIKPWSLGDVELVLGIGGSVSVRRPWEDERETKAFVGITSEAGVTWFVADRTGLKLTLDLNVYPGARRELELTPALGFGSVF